MKNKTILVSFDEIISHSVLSDLDSVIPNWELVNRLNRFFELGYEIHCYLSRDDEYTEIKYKPKLLNFLSKHKIKFTNLRFDVPDGLYYIDSKHITSNNFINLDVIKFSSKTERHGDTVFKFSENCFNEYQWYEYAEYIIKVPKIYSLLDQTLKMEYIEKTEAPTLSSIEITLEKFKNTPTRPTKFNTYLDSLEPHLKYYSPDYREFVIGELKKCSKYYESNTSFCHGNFTLEHMISRDGILYLVSPGWCQELWSSWLLDVSKLLQNTRQDENQIVYNYFKNKYNTKEIKLLEITQWIKVRAQYSNKPFVDKTIQELLDQL